MTIVSNTSPLCYLTLIGHAEILPKLYVNVHIARKILEELRYPDACPRRVESRPHTYAKVRAGKAMAHFIGGRQRLTVAFASHVPCGLYRAVDAPTTPGNACRSSTPRPR